MVGLREHGVEVVEREVLREELVRELVDFDEGLELNDAGDVVGLEAGDGEVERLLEAVVDALADEAVQVDGAAQELHVALPEQGHVSENV